jgi:hypothetical protein
VVGAARQAFALSFDVTSVLMAGVMLLTAALVAGVLRDDSSEQCHPA